MSPQYEMEIIHVIRGPDIPLYCNIEFNGTGYVIGSNSEYEVVYKSSNQSDTVNEEQQKSINIAFVLKNEQFRIREIN